MLIYKVICNFFDRFRLIFMAWQHINLIAHLIWGQFVVCSQLIFLEQNLQPSLKLHWYLFLNNAWLSSSELRINSIIIQEIKLLSTFISSRKKPQFILIALFTHIFERDNLQAFDRLVNEFTLLRWAKNNCTCKELASLHNRISMTRSKSIKNRCCTFVWAG